MNAEAFYEIHAYVLLESSGVRLTHRSEDERCVLGQLHAVVHSIKQAGIFAGGAGLEPPETATSVRISDGKRLVQDGPFADTKEQLGGFFIIDVPDLDTALDWAARYPAGPGGGVEVRPAMAGPDGA